MVNGAKPQVLGPVVDDQTRCVHYRTRADIVAIKFRCCGEFYPCVHCHAETAGHDPEQWPAETSDEHAILCGVCWSTMSIAHYMIEGKCGTCNAAFNPRCRLHYPHYFAFEVPQRIGAAKRTVIAHRWRRTMSEVRDALKQRAKDDVEQRRDALLELSHAIHANPELSWEEHESAARVAGALKDAGFAVELGAYGVPTAFEAVYGDGDFTVAICAEYDALPGIGHGCGHNVIASAAVGAGIALAHVAEEAGLRVIVFGTPAEEHGGGKVAMLEAGAWEGVDISLMVHGMTEAPGMTADNHAADAMKATAVDRYDVTFHGKTAHAAGMPELGLNASNAAVLALNAIAMLRQHLPKETNLNAFISHGGEATNIIPERSEVQVELRAYDLDIWRDMKQRVLKCFEGAAIATGCDWEWAPTEHPYAPVIHNEVMCEIWDRNLEALGRTIDHEAVLAGGSTDMGNVSQVVPSIHPLITFMGHDAPAHNHAFTEAAVSESADSALIDAAVALAHTVIDVATDPELRSDFQRQTASRPEGSTRVTLQT